MSRGARHWTGLVAAFALVFAACQPAFAADGGKITIVDRNLDANRAYFEPAIQEFRKLHPDIEVEYLQVGDYFGAVTSMVAAGLPIDVVWVHSPGYDQFYRPNDLLLDLTPMMERESVFEEFLRPVLDQYTDGERYYNLPTGVGGIAMLYNADALNAAGLAPPPSHWTWADFEEYLTVLRRVAPDGSVERYGAHVGSVAERSSHWFDQNDVAIWDPETGGVMTPVDRALEVLEFFNRGLHESQILHPYLWYAANSEFQNEQIVFLQDGPWAFGHWLSTPIPFKIAAAMPPRNRNQNTFIASQGYGIIKHSQNPEAAWKFIRFLTSKEMAALQIQTLGLIPPRFDSLHIWREQPGIRDVVGIEAFMDVLEAGRDVMLGVPNSAQVVAAYNQELARLWQGEASPGEILEVLVQRITAEINR